jgi:hypothetical protein
VVGSVAHRHVGRRLLQLSVQAAQNGAERGPAEPHTEQVADALADTDGVSELEGVVPSVE